MTWTGADVLLAGAAASLTPVGVALLPLLVVAALGSVDRATRRIAVAPGLGLAVLYSLALLLRDPLVARSTLGPHALAGLVLVGLGVWRWRPASGFPGVAWLAPALGLLVAMLRPGLAGPRLLLLQGSEGGLMPIWLYHLGTGLVFASVFLGVYLTARWWGEAKVRRVSAVGWMAAGVLVASGGLHRLTLWLLLKWPSATFG